MNDFFYAYLIANIKMTDQQIAQLEGLVTTRDIRKGEFLLQNDQICKHSFFIATGLVRLYTIDNIGKEHIVQFAPENWFTSDRGSVYFNEPSEYYIDAIEDSTVILLDIHFYNLALEISPEFRMYNEKLLHNHIRHLQKRISLLIGASAEERYLDFIELYPDLTLRVPQWMIASFLGITSESLSRVRKELARRNFRP
jgi:CRP-like cAMP-binding protein